MEFKYLVQERYNVKKFDGRIVDEAKLEELFDIIRYAPSADNLQPWKVKVISDPETKERLLPAIMPFNHEKVQTCSHLLIFCADRELNDHWNKLNDRMKAAGYPEDVMRHMGTVAKMIMSREPKEMLNRSQWDVFLAVGNAVNGAKSLGFDSSLFGGFNVIELTRILELPQSLVPTLIVALGYTADKPLKKIRFPKSEVFF